MADHRLAILRALVRVCELFQFCVRVPDNPDRINDDIALLATCGTIEAAPWRSMEITHL